MIIGQAIFQLAVTLVLYFAGPEILKYAESDATKMVELDTIIFNTFVWMQIFNMFNNRRLDNRFNIFEALHRNHFFIFICALMVGLQITIVFVGSRAFAISSGGIDGTQWAICIIVSIMCLPWGMLVRLFPDAWFGAIAGFVGKPVVIAYNALGAVFSKFGRLFRKKKAVVAEPQDEEAMPAAEPKVEPEAAPVVAPPEIVVIETPQVQITEPQADEKRS